MKKFFYLSLIMAIIGFTSCNKDVNQDSVPAPATGELQLTINQEGFGGFKASDTVPDCSDLSWSYALFTLDGQNYSTGLITMASGAINTEPLKLDVGQHSLTSFLVYNDNGTPTDSTDDILVRAAPLPGSQYYDLMTNKLNVTVDVQAFKKMGYTVDVLCFQNTYYEEFGFTWFNLNDVKVHQICIFGDVCTSDVSLYSGSLYENQENGLQMDMPAIFHALIYKLNDNGVGELQTDTTNAPWYGEGDCLPVHWADDVNKDDEFYLVIKTLLPVGTGYDYVTTDSIYFTNEGAELILDDGVLVFEVGNCSSNPPGPHYQCTAWTNLPTDPFTFEITASPGTLATYFDYQFTGIPSGYAVHDGLWPGWCADKGHYISVGQTYQATFVSSVLPLPGGFLLNQTQVNELNWIFNHLDNYFAGINVEDWTQAGSGYTPFVDWSTIQDAIWSITDGVTVTGTALQIHDDAVNYGATYEPLPDEYGLVFIFIDGTVQLQVTLLYC